jgi:hypothetical protein
MSERLRKSAQDVVDEWHADHGSVRMVSLMMALEDALAEQEAEPVAWMSMSDDGSDLLSFAKPADDPRPVPLYTHPPRREWVGLTEEERIKAIESVYERLPFDIRKARAIEAALKEKNA